MTEEQARSFWDVRIINAAVKTEANEAQIIEVYGKTKDGISVTIRDPITDISKFPYCYIMSDSKELKEYLKSRRDIMKVESARLLYKGKEQECIKLYARTAKSIKYLRDDKNINAPFAAADIPFYLRYIYDNDIDACVRVYGTPVQNKVYSTDVIIQKERFEKIAPFNPDLTVLSFDIENSVKDIFGEETQMGDEEVDDSFYNKNILTICCVVQKNGEIINTGRFSGAEKDILNGFSKFIIDNDPDIVSGYNIEGYDLRVINRRAQELQVELNWGRDHSKLSGFKDPKFNKINWSVTGRVIVDAWWAVKMDLKPKQESLNAVSMQLLGGEQKLNVDPRKMDEEWKKDPEHVMEYCTKDAVLSLKILNKLERLRKMMDLATVSKMPISEVNKNRSSLLIDSILIREADKRKVAVPMAGSYNEDEEMIEGAYVHELNQGVYQWVCVLDFKSMYPSIIISKNICFTTIDDTGTIVSPSGSKFLSKDKKEGILPNILANLMKERDETKKKMKEAKTTEEKQYYDGLQNAIKIYMNSFYGVFASSFYRFTDRNIGSSVTGFAREITKGIIKDIESQGHQVLYSDTDSIFVKSPEDNLEGAKKFGMTMIEKYSKEGGILEFEKILKSMFSHGKKKRYVGKIIWPKEEMIIRGYEIRRTDSFDMLSETMLKVFDEILEGKIDEAMRLCRQTVKSVSKGQVDVKKLIISKGCKAFHMYAAPESQAAVQAAKKMMVLGYEFIPGMKVAWVVTNSKRTPLEVEPYIEGREFLSTPDWKYYAGRMAQSLARITEVYGISEKELLRGSIQGKLFDEDGSDYKIKQAEKKLTLTDMI